MLKNKLLFVVNCERIGKRAAYSVRFPINNEIVQKIKDLPEETRKWNPSTVAWEITSNSLYLLIKKFRNVKDIHFDFGSDDSRKVFINQIKKFQNNEIEKRKFIADLNIKKEQWVQYKTELETTYEKYSDKLHELLNPEVRLFPHQIVAAMFMNVTRSTLISHEMGLGKCQDLNSKLLTPKGWVRMGDINVGDDVIGSDGKSKKVLGIYPQGIKKIFEITFSDGSTVRSCDEHLWSVSTYSHNLRKNSYITKTLREIVNGGLQFKNGNDKWYIPIVKPITFESKELRLNPYVLGCVLGHYAKVDNGLLELRTIDDDIMTEMRNELSSNLILDNIISDAFSHYGLIDCNLSSLFIPNDYIFSSIEQRVELLRGILDVNGKSSKNGVVEVSLESKELINNIKSIVQSLGGIATLNECLMDDKIYYELSLRLPSQFIPFRVDRMVKTFAITFKNPPVRSMIDVKYVGKMEAQCILIDSDDHLYVTDNYILTHNTLSSILYVEMNNFKRVVVITPNSLKFNYYYEVQKFTKSLAYVVNWKKNKCAIEDAKYIIVNYDFFNPSKSDKFNDKWNKLNIKDIDCVILDECQKIKNTKTNIFRNFKKTFNKKIFNGGVESKMFLSGTPAPNRAYELYTVLNQISPTDFPTKKHFYEYYCGMTYDVGGWGYVSDDEKTRFEELFHKIAPFTHRKKKADVLKDLPDKQYQRVILDIDKKEEQTYNDIESSVVNEFLLNPTSNPLTIMLRLRQFLSTIKVKHVIELVDNILETGEKVILVDMFKESLYALKKHYGDIAELHTGDQKVEERSDVVKLFQDTNSKTKIFLGSIQTANYGLTLTAASKMFILTLPYSVGEYDQVADRCHRIGQKNAVNIYPLIFPDTIDDYVYSKIEDKRREIVKVLDNEDYKSKISESVFSEVIEQLKRKYSKK